MELAAHKNHPKKKKGNKFQLCPAKWKINQVSWQASEYMPLLQKLAANDFSLGADRKGASIDTVSSCKTADLG